MLVEEKERVKSLLKETVVLLCKNGLNFKDNLCLEALIGITVDKNEVLLISINETVRKDSRSDDFCCEIQSNKQPNYLCEDNYEAFNENCSRKNLACEVGDEKNCSEENSYIETSKEKNFSKKTVCEGNNKENDEKNKENQKETQNINTQNTNRSSENTSIKNLQFKIEPLEENEQPLTDKIFSNSHNNCNAIPSCDTIFSKPDQNFLKDLASQQHQYQNYMDFITPSFLTSRPTTDENLLNTNEQIMKSDIHPATFDQSSDTINAPPRSNKMKNRHHRNFSDDLPRQSSPKSSTQNSFYIKSSNGRYNCDICSKEFRVLRDLRAHLATKHHLKKDFDCPICSVDFTYKHNLLAHIRSVHNVPTNNLISGNYISNSIKLHSELPRVNNLPSGGNNDLHLNNTLLNTADDNLSNNNNININNTNNNVNLNNNNNNMNLNSNSSLSLNNNNNLNSNNNTINNNTNMNNTNNTNNDLVTHSQQEIVNSNNLLGI